MEQIKQQPKQQPKQKPNNKESNSFSGKVEKGDNKTEDLTRWGDLQKKWGYMTIRRGRPAEKKPNILSLETTR